MRIQDEQRKFHLPCDPSILTPVSFSNFHLKIFSLKQSHQGINQKQTFLLSFDPPLATAWRMWQWGTLQNHCRMYNFCSITATVTSNERALPSPWLAALANPPGEEVPLPEALVRAEVVRGHRTAGAHPQGDWNLLSWVTCGGTARENELATYLLSMTSVHNRKHRQQVLDIWVQ